MRFEFQFGPVWLNHSLSSQLGLSRSCFSSAWRAARLSSSSAGSPSSGTASPTFKTETPTLIGSLSTAPPNRQRQNRRLHLWFEPPSLPGPGCRIVLPSISLLHWRGVLRRRPEICAAERTRHIMPVPKLACRFLACTARPSSRCFQIDNPTVDCGCNCLRAIRYAQFAE